MKKLQIIGNSHVGALRKGWSVLKADGAAEDVDFFAVPSGIMPFMRMSPSGIFGLGKNAKVSKSHIEMLTKINGGTEFELDPDAATVWSGQKSGVGSLFRLALTCQIDEFEGSSRPTKLSNNAFNAFVADSILENMPPNFLVDSPAGPVHVLWMPIASEDLMTSDGQKPLDGASAAALRQLTRFYFHALEVALSNRGLGHIPQSPDTLNPESGLTRHEFCRHGIWLRDRGDRKDYFHMNEDFGRLQMKHILGLLEEHQGKTRFRTDSDNSKTVQINEKGGS